MGRSMRSSEMMLAGPGPDCLLLLESAWSWACVTAIQPGDAGTDAITQPDRIVQIERRVSSYTGHSEPQSLQ